MDKPLDSMIGRHSLVSLLQVFDTQFPSGGYAHSLGLEGLVQNGVITSYEDLLSFTQEEVLPCLTHTDLPIFRFTYNSVMDAKYSWIQKMDHLSNATKGTKEMRSSGIRMGRQLARLIQNIWGEDSEFLQHWKEVDAQLTLYQWTPVLASFCAIKNTDLFQSMTAYSLQVVQSWAQASIKLIALGPTQAQRYVARIGQEISRVVLESEPIEMDKIGYFSSRWDIASSLHENAPSRLFIS
jgi:urease accessory protein